MDVTNWIATAAHACAEQQTGETFVDETGLLRCKACGGPRQFVRDFTATPGFESIGTLRVSCACRCMSERFAEQERIRAEEKRRDEIKALRKAGFPDSEMIGCTFAVDDRSNERISDGMMRYCDAFKDLRNDGRGLLLYGGVGTGKTFYAACIVNDLIDRGYPCMMTTFTRLINRMQDTWDGRQDFVDALAEYALIAIDDLGVERDTAYMNEAVTTIIDALYRNRVPLIITSNFSPAQMVDDADIRRKRVYDRLLERCHPVKVDGESRRKTMGRNGFRDMRNLLGV